MKTDVCLTQGSPNFFVPGPHNRLHNSSGSNILRNAIVSEYVTSFQINKLFVNMLLYSLYWQNVFAAAWNGFAGRSLETLVQCIQLDFKLIPSVLRKVYYFEKKRWKRNMQLTQRRTLNIDSAAFQITTLTWIFFTISHVDLGPNVPMSNANFDLKTRNCIVRLKDLQWIETFGPFPRSKNLIRRFFFLKQLIQISKLFSMALIQGYLEVSSRISLNL